MMNDSAVSPEDRRPVGILEALCEARLASADRKVFVLRDLELTDDGSASSESLALDLYSKDGQTFSGLEIYNCTWSLRRPVKIVGSLAPRQEGCDNLGKDYPCVVLNGVRRYDPMQPSTIILYGIFSEIVLEDLEIDRLALGDQLIQSERIFRVSNLELHDCRINHLTTMFCDDLDSWSAKDYGANFLDWGGGTFGRVDWIMRHCTLGRYRFPRESEGPYLKLLDPPKIGMITVSSRSWARYFELRCRDTSIVWSGQLDEIVPDEPSEWE